MSIDLNCEELVELVTEYMEGALTPPERARFEEHVMSCPPCSAHLEQMRHTIEAVGRLSVDSLEPGVERDLLEAFRSWKAS